MKKICTQLTAALALLGALGAASTAQAAWTFTGVDGGAATTSGYTDAGISLSIAGYQAINGSTTLAGDGITAATLNSGFLSGTKWAASGSNLTFYSGGGLGNVSDGATSPNHATDNAGTNTESVLMQFGSSVTLKTVTTGYVFGDSDFSVFRWTGGSTAPVLTNTVAASTASSGGWELVGNYDGGSAVGSNTINSGNVGSSWWLVSAYNYSFGSGTNVDQGNDFFKIYSVAGTACTAGGTTCGGTNGGSGVPEPTSLALVAIAGLGAVGARRRKPKLVD